MKSFIVFAVLVAAALASPINPDAVAEVLRFDNYNIGVGGYNFGYETSNGIAAGEEASLVDVGTQEESLAVRGSFRYLGPDGITYEVTYTADKNGFQPQGAHIPKAA